MESTEMSRCGSPQPKPSNLQIQANEDGAGAFCRCRCTSPSPAASDSLPDGDDILREILTRLPPQPSSLSRVSAVCKRWQVLVNDPRFARQFYVLHRKPPLLGVFEESCQGIVFKPLLDPPDRIPSRRFNLGFGIDNNRLLDCRHGRVLVEDWVPSDIFVCNPITSEQRRVAVPLEIRRGILSGAVLCAAADHGHVHGGCHSSPFKVVLLSPGRSVHDQALAYVYSSETSLWGNPIPAEAPCMFIYGHGAPLIGNCLYWLSYRDGILEFDLSNNSLTLIMEPPIKKSMAISTGNRRIIPSESGLVGFTILCYPHFHMWQRNLNAHGVATWTPWKAIKIHTILGLTPWIEEPVGSKTPNIVGYDEDHADVICVNVDHSVYMVNLKSLQSRKLYETDSTHLYHPFKSFYTLGDAKGCCS